MRILETRFSWHILDLVQLQILEDAAALHLNDFPLVVHKVMDGEVVLERIVDAIQAPLRQAGEIESGLAQSLAGHSAGVNAAAAGNTGPFDHGDPLAEVRRLGAGFFAGRTTANDDQIE